MVQADSTINSSDNDHLCREYIAAGVNWVNTAPSRGGQIALGVDCSNTDWVWVLHVDSSNLNQALDYMLELSRSNTICWGRFDVRLLGYHKGLAWVARTMNWRSRMRRICTGDQGMFFHRSLLKQIGGFPSQPLMEDIEVSKLLRRQGKFRAPHIAITSSGERWMRYGLWRTVLSMWRWRLRYFIGVSAQQLYREYYATESRKQAHRRVAESDNQ